MRQIDVVEYLIRKGPGRTGTELARAIHGDRGYQQQVGQECAMLVAEGRVERQGAGGKGDPHRFLPIGAPDAARWAIDRAFAIFGSGA
jgi:hypothetical protein